ncbi:hypothetical protein ACXYMT_12900 [Salinimicrobium sp. CAU 1759]
MKTLIFYLVLLVFGTGHAQQITELKEAKVGFAPLSSEVKKSGNSFSFNVKESYAGEFEKDPLAFMDAYFDIENFINALSHEDYDSYEVSFVSRKGILKADFNAEGDLVRSSSRFKNIVLPEKLRSQLYRDHKGWAMTKNVHITRGNAGILNKSYYKIKLENGKDRKRITLEAPLGGTEVASK